MSLTKNQNSDFGDDIVLEKNIFSKVFDKDIKRVYLYKKTERIAKAIQLVSPAFKDSKPLRERIERLSVELIDASVLPPNEARERLSRNLLTLSSTLELGKSGGFLSDMNADIILREARNLLQEMAAYEEPRIALPDAPTMSQVAKDLPRMNVLDTRTTYRTPVKVIKTSASTAGVGGVRKPEGKSNRKEEILGILRSRDASFIKDISVRFRDVSEKTIQRELQQLVLEGRAEKSGERRWTTYRAKEPDSTGPATVTAVDQEAFSG